MHQCSWQGSTPIIAFSFLVFEYSSPIMEGSMLKMSKRTYTLITYQHMDVSENRGIPKSSILIGFSIINHPFWGYHSFRKHPYPHDM